MQEVEITDEMLLEARKSAKELGKLNNSIEKGAGNLAGFLGEIIVRETFGYKSESTYDYDLVDQSGLKIDVKTKRTTVTPKPNYECSVAAFNTKQKCDKYVFVRVLNDLSKGWILGEMNKGDYFESATYMPKGKIDPANGFRVKANCYNVAIQDLNECS
tara:strand:+ start:527 stop:1003 length:477 start_codon:yes stop_codon:yes gene_type:complete